MPHIIQVKLSIISDMKKYISTFLLIVCVNSCNDYTYNTIIRSIGDEKWWGAIMNDGSLQPYKDLEEFNLENQCRNGATVPFLVSSRGRYVWSERPFRFSFSNGTLKIRSHYEKVLPVQAGNTLKEAYVQASAKHFPFTSQTPPEEMFTKPQFNNWIEVATCGINQRVTEDYIDAIYDNGFPCGVLMIDGGWMIQHGSTIFNPETFPAPKNMFEKIRSYGYKGMLWTSNFISADNRREYLDYRLAGPRKRPLLLESNEYPGEECIVHWWSGKSVTFDLTNPEALKEFADNLEKFRKAYGFDGFKSDVGVDVNLTNRHLCSAAKLLLGNTDSIGKLTAKSVDLCYALVRNGGRAVKNDGETGKTLANLFENIESERRRNENAVLISRALLCGELICTVRCTDRDCERVNAGSGYELLNLLGLCI